MSARLAVPVVLAAVLMAAADARAASFGLEVRGGYRDLTGFNRTADALFGSRGGLAAGGAIRADLGTRWFVRAGAEHLAKSGERVFVADSNGPIFSLGHPLDFWLLPAFADVGFRFASRRMVRGYLGAGAGAAWARETSTIAGEVDRTTTARFAARALLGASYGRGHVQIGGEIAYATIPKGAGLLDVSKAYGETNLGGVSATAVLTLKP
jgi:hypothetical protein